MGFFSRPDLYSATYKFSSLNKHINKSGNFNDLICNFFAIDSIFNDEYLF